MRRILAAFIILSLAATVSNAADYSTDSSGDSKISNDKSLSTRDSDERKSSTSSRKSKSKTTGRDKSQSTSAKDTGSTGDSGGLDTTLAASMLFTAWQPPAAKLARDFGLSGDQGYGYINTTMQDYLAQAAKANTPVKDVTDEANIRAYLIEIAEAGATLGQAMINLQGDTARIGKIQRTKEGIIEVRGLGQDDLLILADGALKRAQQGITDKRIKLQLEQIKRDTTPCRLLGEPTLIQCGQSVLSLSSPPILKLTGVPWYAADGFNLGFAGISASYKVASSWSWSRALEEAKSDSKFTKLATEASMAAEQLVAQGKTFEAAMTKRKAVEKMQRSGQGLSASKFIPAIH